MLFCNYGCAFIILLIFGILPGTLLKKEQIDYVNIAFLRCPLFNDKLNQRDKTSFLTFAPNKDVHWLSLHQEMTNIFLIMVIKYTAYAPTMVNNGRISETCVSNASSLYLVMTKSVFMLMYIQSTHNGSNIFRTVEICSRHG